MTTKAGTKRKPRPTDFDDERAVLRDMAKALDVSDPDELEIKRSHLSSFGAGEFWEVEEGGRTYVVAKNDDVARELALEVVEQDLKHDPGVFKQDWLAGHIDKKKLRDELESDVRGETESYVEDIADTDAPRFWDEAEAWRVPDLPEPDEETDERPDDVDDSAKEALIDRIVEDKLKDPMGYLDDIYGSEAAAKAMEIAGIDIEAAAEDAVQTDGWQHFLARYDGNSYDTPGGLVYWREN